MAKYNDLLNNPISPTGRMSTKGMLVSVSTKTDPRQVKNDAGGYVFKTNPLVEFERWLILGAEGNTYYVNQATSVHRMRDNFLAVINGDTKFAKDAIRLAVDISVKGRAPKVDPVLYFFALAVRAKSDSVRAEAQWQVRNVLRTASHLFTFNSFIEGTSRGRGLRGVMDAWYNTRSPEDLAYQLVKYRNRMGYTHRDVMLLGHVKTAGTERNSILRWAAGKVVDFVDTPALRMIAAVEALEGATVGKVVGLIHEFNLPREVIPTQFLRESKVWEALLEKMPTTAVVRNLNNLQKHGILDNRVGIDMVRKSLTVERMTKARIHPLNLYLAYTATTGVAHEVRGILETAFYESFGALPVYDTPVHYSLDTSGSMSVSVNGMQNVSCMDAGAVYGMVLSRQFPNMVSTVFNYDATPVDYFRKGRRLDQVVKDVARHGGGTYVGRAIEYHAQHYPQHHMILFTDGMTWGGSHPYQQVDEVRRRFPSFKMVTVAAQGGNAQLSRPDDVQSLNVSGFDISAAQVIGGFFGHGMVEAGSED